MPRPSERTDGVQVSLCASRYRRRGHLVSGVIVTGRFELGQGVGGGGTDGAYPQLATKVWTVEYRERTLSKTEYQYGTEFMAQSKTAPAPAPNMELTTTQKRALGIYCAFTEKHGTSPSVRQFADLLGVSKSSAHQLTQLLVAKGHVRPRAITVTRLMPSAKGKRAV